MAPKIYSVRSKPVEDKWALPSIWALIIVLVCSYYNYAADSRSKDMMERIDMNTINLSSVNRSHATCDMNFRFYTCSRLILGIEKPWVSLRKNFT